jgi:hypothetical protein
VNYGTLLNRESTYPANFSLALGPVANGGFLFKQPFKTEFQKADRGAPGQNRPASLIVAGFRAGKTSSRAHILRMTEKPKFHSKMIKNGRWTVVVTTGYGPESRVGDFATEEEAQRWISTKSKDWSPPTGDSKCPPPGQRKIERCNIQSLTSADSRDSFGAVPGKEILVFSVQAPTPQIHENKAGVSPSG